MTVTEVLDKLFEKLNHDLVGGNYLIYLEAQNDLEEIVKNELEDSSDKEVESLESENEDLREEIADLEDSCNCDCKKCEKCLIKND